MTAKASVKVAIPPVNLTFDKKHVRKVVRTAGLEIAAATRAILNQAVGDGALQRGPGGSAGKWRGGYKKGAYRASAAGQAPAKVTGTLAKSIKSKLQRGGDYTKITDAAFYALILEAGAQGGGSAGKGDKRKGLVNTRARSGGKRIVTQVAGVRVMQPRPFLTLALEQRGESIAARIETAVMQDVAFVRLKAKP